jgi:peptide/nickel transport system permease protein
MPSRGCDGQGQRAGFDRHAAAAFDGEAGGLDGAQGVAGGMAATGAPAARPWLVLAAPLGAMCLRLTLNTTLDAMDEDYVRTGTAKGLAPRRVVLRHAAPASFVTTASFVGISIPRLVLVERTLAVPGFLRHTWKALGTMDAGHERLTDHGPRPDFPMLCALTVWGCVLIVVLGLISDAVLPWLDPGIRRSD